MRLRPVEAAGLAIPAAAALIAALAGCVSLHAPLERVAGYPADWPDPATLGPECQALGGTYANDGVLVAADGATSAVALTRLLNLPEAASRVTLAVHTRKVDQHGDTFATLTVVPDGRDAGRGNLDDCFCIRQTLACPKVTEAYWSIPNLGIGGRQRNVYLSVAADRSLVVRLQEYHLDVIVAVPLYGQKEPWARFLADDDP